MSSWVLLRGLTREQAHWGAFPLLLAEETGTRVVTLDLPGAGTMRHMRCPLSVEAMVETSRQQLQTLGVSAPYNLLGLSLGGMVAAAWATDRVDEIAAIVLVNTSMRPFSPPWDRLRLAQLPLLVSLLGAPDPRRTEQAILRLTSASPQLHADVIDDWVEIRRTRPVSAANALRQLLAAARYTHPARTPQARTLVVCSAGDMLVAPQCSRELSERLEVERITHPSAGHDLPLDDGRWLAACVARWHRRELSPHSNDEAGP